MQQRQCDIAGCDRPIPPRSYSPLCDSCRHVVARHGHPRAKHLTAYELAAFVRIVRDARQRNADSPVWSILVQRLERLRDIAAAEVAEWEAGKATHGPTRLAAEAVLQVTRAAAPEAILEVLLAVAVQYRLQPHRWPDERAHRFALVRRFRGLAPMAVGKSWDHKRQQVRGVYRCLPQRATDILGQWLVDILGPAGTVIAEADQRRKAAPIEERERLHAALEGLQ